MTNKQRDAAFKKAQKAQRKALKADSKASLAAVKTELNRAKKELKQLLSGINSDYKQWHLKQLQEAVESALKNVDIRLAEIAEASSAAGWRHGVDMVDKPLAAGGIRISSVLPQIDTAQLAAMQTFAVDKMSDVTTDVAKKIKGQLANVMIGISSPSDVAGVIGKVVDGGRSRAITIMRSEMGRAYSTATQARQQQAAEVVPGLQKQWRRSGKIHSRQSHDLADGQIVDVDKPFQIGHIKMMHPHDSSAPASEVINCGCTSLPYMASWNVKQSGRVPFSDEEQRLNPIKRDLEAALSGK